MLKRRYRSTETNEKLRRLEYFAHPFEPGNDIKLVDDVNLPSPVSLESLATQFAAVEEDSKKEQHAVDREDKAAVNIKKKKSFLKSDKNYDPFDMSESIQF